MMFKTVNFNIFEENLESEVYGKGGGQDKSQRENDVRDQPIPKPAPQYWNDPLSYRRSNRECEGTRNIL